MNNKILIKKFENRFGFISIYQIGQSIIISVPENYISISLIRKDVQFLKELDSTGFQYFVDFRKFSFPNPFNLIYLSKIKRIEHVLSYHLISDNRIQRFIFKLFSATLGITKIHSSRSFNEMMKNSIQD